MENQPFQVFKSALSETDRVTKLCKLSLNGDLAEIKRQNFSTEEIDTLTSWAVMGEPAMILGVYNALMIAASYRHIDVVKYFLEEKKANILIDGGRRQGYTAVDCAKFPWPWFAPRVNQGLVNFMTEWMKDALKVKDKLLRAVTYGDLGEVKLLLSHKNGAQVFKKIKEDNEFNTLLTLAAIKGDMSVVDYLIRHYYIPANFAENENPTLRPYAGNKAVTYYCDVVNLFSKKSVIYSEINGLLENTKNDLKGDELSYIYLITLWMLVRHCANNQFPPPPLRSDYFLLSCPIWNLPWNVEALVEAFVHASQMYQLRPEHRAELEVHMIREGSVLIGWTMYSKELAFKDIVIDRRQVNAMEKLVSTTVETIILEGARFASREVYQSFLAILARITPSLKSLTMSDCNLDDEWLHDLLKTKLIQKAPLLTLNFDNNNISQNGYDWLLRKISKRSATENINLSLRFNSIELVSRNDLTSNLDESLLHIKALNLEGNAVVGADEYSSTSEEKSKKYRNKSRESILSELLYHLAKKDGNFTPRHFLTATKASIAGGYGNNKFFLTLGDESQRQISLEQSLVNDYYKLPCNEEDENKKSNAIFLYLKKDIFITIVPNDLLDLKLSDLDRKKLKIACNQLLSYHFDARLKGLLTTHSFLRTKRIESAPSLLFPEIRLTRNVGSVYLFSNKKGLHSMLGFEYLTGYGQRMLMVAHLQLRRAKGSTKKKIVIEAVSDNPITNFISNLHENEDIARLPADTKSLKAMRNTIHQDIKNQILPGRFEKSIMVTFRDDETEDKKQIKNCVTYCTDTIKQHLGFKIKMSPYWFFTPGGLVDSIQKNGLSITEPCAPTIR